MTILWLLTLQVPRPTEKHSKEKKKWYILKLLLSMYTSCMCVDRTVIDSLTKQNIQQHGGINVVAATPEWQSEEQGWEQDCCAPA